MLTLEKLHIGECQTTYEVMIIMENVHNYIYIIFLHVCTLQQIEEFTVHVSEKHKNAYCIEQRFFINHVKLISHYCNLPYQKKVQFRHTFFLKI